MSIELPNPLYTLYTDPDSGLEIALTTVGTRGRKGGPWRECTLCGESFSVKDMAKIRGRYYGVPCTCAESMRREVSKTASRVYTGGRR